MTSVPAKAKQILDLIASVEAGPNDQYNVVYGHHEHSLPKPITAMTLSELMANQAHWGKEWGSSAAGRYQIMPQTLAGLIHSLNLNGTELFSPATQDALGYQLLVNRGYIGFTQRSISIIGFGLNLAKEWASFPVLAPVYGAHRMLTRGQSYYAGDGLNKALLKPETVEALLTSILATPGAVEAQTPLPAPPPTPTPPKAAPAASLTILERILNWFK